MWSVRNLRLLQALVYRLLSEVFTDVWNYEQVNALVIANLHLHGHIYY